MVAWQTSTTNGGSWSRRELSSAARPVAQINTSPSEPIGIRRIRGYVGQDYSVIRDTYGSVFVIDLELTEHPISKNIEEFAEQYPKSIIPAFGRYRKAIKLSRTAQHHRFVGGEGDKILLPRHITAKLYHNVSNDSLDILKEESLNENIEWRGKIEQGKDEKDLVTELIAAEQRHLIHEYEESLEETERSAINNDPAHPQDIELFYQASTVRSNNISASNSSSTTVTADIWQRGYEHCSRFNCSICKPVEHFMAEYQKVKKRRLNYVAVGTQLDSKQAKQADFLLWTKDVMHLLSISNRLMASMDAVDEIDKTSLDEQH
jgi:hypothetical protein